MLDKED